MPFPINFLILSSLLFGAIVFANTIYCAFYYFNLLRYLKRTKYFRYEELTSIGKFGPGLNNPYRMIPYIYSELDNEDDKIARHKGSIRIGHRYWLLNFIALLVIMGLFHYAMKY